MFTVLCRHSHSNWQSNAAFLYVLAESNIMWTWKYIIVLDIKGKQYFKLYYMYIVEIPMNKRANSYKLKILKNRELKLLSYMLFTLLRILL